MTKYLKPIARIFTLLFYFTGNLLAQHNHQHDTPSVHGMILFGNKTIYLSHLPMFHSPHDYQVLLEVEIPSSILKIYQKNLTQYPTEKVYTIVPEPFSLTHLQKGLKFFSAQIFKGHFERGGIALTEEVKFKVKKVLYFEKLTSLNQKSTALSYIFLADQNEHFLIHKIASKPSFDHITKVRVKDLHHISNLYKEKVMTLTFDTSDSLPLQDGSLYLAKLKDRLTYSLEVEPTESLYLEYGDLSF